ncbi:Glycosyltransferase involved in cell wall bisynthesis [Paenibacillus sp. UNCCL117]|uniref:glycosyltransferase n=1 Tax=unclassified Paenibacillus TaxID=185978 RepID=UPI00088D0C72|nr:MULTISPECIES: glycosyltransferase [unclassified Paenibacillus]SDD91643.1 Glycosyltransferase involved in cell wall bisynthesis [Paenibacillus sp. cl123]SFW43658.1 Glycosyltransferase involved in cell wall bisynthesis [Paenibacillus sp. UNCCL117]
MPKVSVVVAAYESERTIKKCIDSILNQTLSDIEIVVIDDGSKDNTLNILNDYKNKYSKIQVFSNNVNRGAGYTKNLGVSKCTGEYIGFVDSDDYLSEDYYKKMYDVIKKNNADIACVNIALVYPQFTQTSFLLENNTYVDFNQIKFNQKAEEIVLDGLIIAGHWSAASASNKLFKSELIKKYSFYEGACDDVPAVIPVIACANKIVYIPELFYNYVQSENSLERSLDYKNRIDVANSYALTLSKLAELKVSDEYAMLLFVQLCSYIETIRNIKDPSFSFKILMSICEIIKDLRFLQTDKNPYLKQLFITHTDYNSFYLVKFRRFLVDHDYASLEEFILRGEETKTMYNPLVSIIIPVYNGSNYMRDAIDSALYQTYNNIEVIVINDGSKDDGQTEKIALSYGDKIRYFRKENGGVASALNLGIEKMKGEYFSWLSHDDLYTNNKIENQIEILSKLEDKKTLVTGGYVVVNSSGEYLYDVDPLNNHMIEDLENTVYPLLRGAIHGCAILIHKSHFERVGIFNTNLPTTQDYDLFFRMLRGQKIHFHKGLHVKSRVHDQQDSRKLVNVHVEECNQLWINMMKELTYEEKCLIDGSEYSFYKNIYNFLKNVTLYEKAIIYSLSKFIETARDEMINNPKNTELLQDLLSCVGVTEKEYYVYRSEVTKTNNKKRIAFLSGALTELGGLTKVLLSVASMLSEHFDVFIINLFGEQLIGGYEYSDNIKILNYNTYVTTKDSENELAKRLKLYNIDLAVISHNCNEVFLRLYPVLRMYNIKTIAWNHEFYFLPHIKEELYKDIPSRTKYLEEADVAIWLNSFSANIYALLNSNAAILPNPVTISHLNENEMVEIEKRPKNLVAIGRFDDSQKGLEQLLYAFAEVLKEIPSTKLYIVGSYDLSQPTSTNRNLSYNKLIRNLDIPDTKIIFTGWIKDITPYLNSSCVHLAPSHHEGFGLVVTETAFYGLPSIIFEGSGMDDIVSDGESGFIVPMDDFSAMAEKAIELLKDDELLKNMSGNAKSICLYYEPNKIIAKWRKLINAILEMSDFELSQLLKDEFMYPVKNQESFIRQAIQEYDKFTSKIHFYSNIKPQNDNQNRDNTEIVYLATNNNIELYELEIARMQKSLSWKVTKPLRLFRLTLRSLKENGLKSTIKKIIVKIKNKL